MLFRMLYPSALTSLLAKPSNIVRSISHDCHTVGSYEQRSSPVTLFSKHSKNSYFKQTILTQQSLSEYFKELRKIKRMYKTEHFDKAEVLASELVIKVKKLNGEKPLNIYILRLLADAYTWEGVCLTGGTSADTKKAISSLENALVINPNLELAKDYLVKNQLYLGRTPPGMTIIRR